MTLNYLGCLRCERRRSPPETEVLLFGAPQKVLPDNDDGQPAAGQGGKMCGANAQERTSGSGLQCRVTNKALECPWTPSDDWTTYFGAPEDTARRHTDPGVEPLEPFDLCQIHAEKGHGSAAEGSTEAGSTGCWADNFKLTME